MRTKTRSRKPAEPWPPPELCLPNLAELERLSRGSTRAGAGQPPRYPDDSRAGRRQKTFDCLSEGQDAKGRVL